MRRLHFETLQPVCPRCRAQGRPDAALTLARVEHERDDAVIEGVLHCPAADCRLEYPIVDGIPLLLPDLRRYVADNLHQLTAREDLGETTEGLLGDASGPGTYYDAMRQQLSTYGWDHYGDLDPAEPRSGPQAGAARPGAVARCLEKGAELLSAGLQSPLIDLGCSVGRSTFASAELSGGPVLGVDVHYSMLRLAGRILHGGRARYPRRRVGIVYDRHEFEARFDNADRVDFWACDALALPFADNTFGSAVGLNVLDCVSAPRDFLEAVSRILRPGGSTLLSTPYDWSPAATPVEAWLGGHSQRGTQRGASEPLLRSLLTPGAHPQSVEGLRITGEIPDFPWHARLHDRSVMSYSVHVIAAESAS